MRNLVLLALGMAASLVASAAFASDVKVSGVHNCCPSCANGIQTALKDAGATNIQLTGTEVSFTTDDTQKAVTALYEAGFAVKQLPEGTKAPATGARGVSGKEIKLEKVHNCCGKCTAAINEALKDVGKTNATAKVTSITVTSENEVQARVVVAALKKAGFNAYVVK